MDDGSKTFGKGWDFSGFDELIDSLGDGMKESEKANLREIAESCKQELINNPPPLNPYATLDFSPIITNFKSTNPFSRKDNEK